MSKKKRMQLKMPKIDFKKCKLPKLSKKRILIIEIVTLVLGVGSVIFFGYRQYEEVSEIKDGMSVIGEEIQLGYHREFNLIDRLELVEVSEFKEDCEEFSFKCLYLGSDIRKEFLAKLKEESFSDDDIEVLNMISSVDMGVKSNSVEYDSLVMQYNEGLNVFPLKLGKLIIREKESIL